METKIKVSENRESRLLVNYSLDLGRDLGISKFLVFAESIQDQRYILQKKETEKIVFLLPRKSKIKDEFYSECSVIYLPDQQLSRSEQFQLGLLIAVINNLVEHDETVLCLTGLVGSLRLDNLLITNLQRDNKWFQNHAYETVPVDILRSREFVRLLDISLKLAKQGREGKKIGTIFVLGDQKSFEKYMKPMILNPFYGHPLKKRNIHNSDLFETIREFATLDGAFVVDNKGAIQNAGVYLSPPNNKQVKLLKGYGARHTVAALFSAATDSLTITISESSSQVTVFFKGGAILQFNQD
ncbi:DNA integrity scanning protein DisA nucleotide-binding domain protein [Desulfopila sp. IMCC35008]|uniref:DNA integrity scanning protein DisA nucleotide-binding domain protein n=1 Tax=Desulfopila sp. IMCC35008 TaxID=2653858 RepID=UPI0013D7A88A|nr:DNA integrity scanning protein DisA nucleotide-binding domain protein [Desulfopila sp. IMCC35008]